MTYVTQYEYIYTHLPNGRYAKSKKNKLRWSYNQRQSFIIPWKLQNSWIISYLVWWLFAKAANLNFIVVKWAKKTWPFGHMRQRESKNMCRSQKYEKNKQSECKSMVYLVRWLYGKSFQCGKRGWLNLGWMVHSRESFLLFVVPRIAPWFS